MYYSEKLTVGDNNNYYNHYYYFTDWAVNNRLSGVSTGSKTSSPKNRLFSPVL